MFPLVGVLAWEVVKSGQPECMNYIWPLIFLLIHSPDEAYEGLQCVCTLNRVFDGTDNAKPATPSEPIHKFKLFCSLVDVSGSARDMQKRLEKACKAIVTNLNEIGNRPHDGVSLTLP